MPLLSVKPTTPDIAIAHAVARNTRPGVEKVAQTLTWRADEKLLLVLAAAGWIGTRRNGEHLRRVGNHALLVTTVAASLLPHILVFDQTRPDRVTVLGHIHGISFSGKRKVAFPSGHAMHMGALASVSVPLPPALRAASRALAVGLSLTRLIVLAHWASDVLAGFVMGALIERLLHPGA
jgi:membrane-associated phospholipid phosphatase